MAKVQSDESNSAIDILNTLSEDESIRRANEINQVAAVHAKRKDDNSVELMALSKLVS